MAYRGLGTFEFLIPTDGGQFVFIEANPRLQVEHTVTEELYGIDLVKTQIRVASGMRLRDVGLDRSPIARGAAIQFRVNMERMTADGNSRPTGGVLTGFALPSGPGVRVDTFGYVGYRTSPRYDSLLAKVIAYSPEGMADAIRRGQRALEEFHIDGVETNIPVLRALVENKDFLADRLSTGFSSSTSTKFSRQRRTLQIGQSCQPGVRAMSATSILSAYSTQARPLRHRGPAQGRCNRPYRHRRGWSRHRHRCRERLSSARWRAATGCTQGSRWSRSNP